MNPDGPTTVEEAQAIIDAEDAIGTPEEVQNLTPEELQQRIQNEFASRAPRPTPQMPSVGQTFVTTAHLINQIKADKGIRLTEATLLKIWELSLFATLNGQNLPNGLFGSNEVGGESEEEIDLPEPNETINGHQEEISSESESTND